MKKLVAVILVLALMIPVVSVADGIDLSALSYDQLIELNHQLVREIMARPEWKEVRIPAGQWKVGEDIPAGVYSFKFIGPWSVNIYVWKTEVKNYANNGMRLNDILDKDRTEIGKFELFDGNILDVGGDIILSRPYVIEF